MKRIKEIMDSPEFGRRYPDFYTDEDIFTARERLKSEGEHFKAYYIRLLQSGYDVIISEQEYRKMTTSRVLYHSHSTPYEAMNEAMMPYPDGDIQYIPAADFLTLSGVFCDGKWYDEFIVSKYGIEHIREVK